MARPKKNPGTAPVKETKTAPVKKAGPVFVDAEGKEVAIPEPLAKTLKAKPGLVAYVSGKDWYFNPVTAAKHFDTEEKKGNFIRVTLKD